MMNISFVAPSPPTLTPIAKGAPLPAPDDAPAPRPRSVPRNSEGFAHSLDRVQTSADAGNEAAPAADPLDALQRTASARQAALRGATLAALAAESSKAAKAGQAVQPDGNGASRTTVAADPLVAPTECPAAGPTLGDDCDFRPDAAAGGLVIPQTVLPAELPLPQPPRTLPAALPTGGRGTDLPPRWPPVADEAPSLTTKPALAWPGESADGVDKLTLKTSGSGTAQRRETDKAERPTPNDDRNAKGPPLPVPPGDGFVTLPLLPPRFGPVPAPTKEPAGNAAAAAQGAAAALATLLPTPNSNGSEATAQAQLQARPGSSEFAQQLGAQVSMWAKDGVQRASLHLNPLELGPVSVQIQLDGNGAQVTLAADLAATRQVLEQALPTLASTLREAGLTLTGGGVFDQARQQGASDGQRAAEPPRSNGSSAEPASERGGRVPLGAPRSRGVVDLMA